MPLFSPSISIAAPSDPVLTVDMPAPPIAVKESGDGRVVRLRRRLSRTISLMGHDEPAQAKSSATPGGGDDAAAPRVRRKSLLRGKSDHAPPPPMPIDDAFITPPQSSAPTQPPPAPSSPTAPSPRPPVLRLASAPPVPAHYRRSPPAPASVPLIIGGAPMVRRRSSGSRRSGSSGDRSGPRSPLSSRAADAGPVPFPMAPGPASGGQGHVDDYFSSASPLTSPYASSSSSSRHRHVRRALYEDPAADDSAIFAADDGEDDEAADEMRDLVYHPPRRSSFQSGSPTPSPALIANERAAALARLEAASSSSTAGRGDYEVTPKPSQSSLATEVGRRPPLRSGAGSSPLRGGAPSSSFYRATSPPRRLAVSLHSSSPPSVGRPGSYRSPPSSFHHHRSDFSPPAFAHGESSESLVGASFPPPPPPLSSPPGSPRRRSALSSSGRRGSAAGYGAPGGSTSGLSLGVGGNGDVFGPAATSRTSLQLDTVQEQEPFAPQQQAARPLPRRRSRSRTEQTTVRPPEQEPDAREDEAVALALRYLKRQLGAAAMQRRPTSSGGGAPGLVGGELEMWGALQDGVLLCKLMNLLNPGTIPAVDRRDISTVHEANLAAFLSAARTLGGLRPRDLFRPADLRAPTPGAVRRVARTVLALRDASGRSSSSDDEASWGRAASSRRGRPLRRSLSSEGGGRPLRPDPIAIPGAAVDPSNGGIQFFNSPTDGPAELSDHSSEDSFVVGLSRAKKWEGSSEGHQRTPPNKVLQPFVSFAREPNRTGEASSSRGRSLYADGKLAQSTIEVMTVVSEETSPRSVDMARSSTSPVTPSTARPTGLPLRQLGASRPGGRRHMSLDSSAEPLELGNASSRMVPQVAVRARNDRAPSGLTRGISVSEHVLQSESPRLRPAVRRHSGLNRVVTVDSPRQPWQGGGSPRGGEAQVPFPHSRPTVPDPHLSPQTVVTSRPRHQSEMYLDRQTSARRRWSGDPTGQRRPRHESLAQPPPPRSRENGVRQKIVISRPGHEDIIYQFGDCIGRGQFGSVYRALNVNSGRVVAIKRIALDSKSKEEVDQLANEVELLKQLSHPSVVSYEGTVQTGHHFNIVLEYVENGSLAHLQKAFGNFPEPLVASYTLKILEGLQYLHSRNVVHCDLKAANILTTKNGNVKLSDFGVSLNLNAIQKKENVAGTPNWMAPEVIQLEGAVTTSDIWSLACTIIELLTGWPPYGGLAPMSAMYNIVEDPCPPIPPIVSPDLEAFLRSCFSKKPSNRPDAVSLAGHAWLKKHWSRELNPQDSIPFLRRLSQGLDHSPAMESSSYLVPPSLDRTGSNSTPDSSSMALPSPTSLGVMTPFLDAVSIVGSDAYGRRSLDLSTSVSQLAETGSAKNEHAFVKSRFSKVVDCRLCREPVRKHAVLCEDCGLICHVKCASRAPLPCDLRAQLLNYKKANVLAAPMTQAVASSSQQSLASTLSHKITGLGRRKSKGPSNPLPAVDPASGLPGRPTQPLRSVSDSPLDRKRRPSAAASGADLLSPRQAATAAKLGHSLAASVSSSEATHSTSHHDAQFGVQPSRIATEPGLIQPSRRKKLAQSLNLGAFGGERKAKEGRTHKKKESIKEECVVS